MDHNDEAPPRRRTPERAAVWLLGIVLLAVVAFVVVLTLLT